MKKFWKILVPILQLVFSVGLLAILDRVCFIPLTYMLLLTGILITALLVTLVLYFFKKKGTDIAGTVWAAIIIIIILVLSIFAIKANSILGDIFGMDTKTDGMVVAVLDSDKADSLREAKYYTFVYDQRTDSENANATVNEINNKLNRVVTTEGCISLKKAVDAMMNSKNTALVFNYSYLGIIEENYKNFGEKIRILYNNDIVKELVSDNDVDVDSESFNIYLGSSNEYGQVNYNGLSGMNRIITVNPKTRQLLFTSIPYTMYIPIVDKGSSFNGLNELVAVIACHGADVSAASLGKMLDIDVPFVAKINYTSLIEMVDSIGGIDILGTEDFRFDGYEFTKGKMHMDGNKALAFSLAIGGNVSERDRDNNEQLILNAIVRKTCNPKYLIKDTQYLGLFKNVFSTNMKPLQAADLIRMQLGDWSSWSISYQVIEGAASTGTSATYGISHSVLIPEKASIAEAKVAIKKVYEGDDGQENSNNGTNKTQKDGKNGESLQ